MISQKLTISISILLLLAGFVIGYGTVLYIDSLSDKNIYGIILKNKDEIENRKREMEIKKEKLKDVEKRAETSLNLWESIATENKNYEMAYLEAMILYNNSIFVNLNSLLNSPDRYTKSYSELQLLSSEVNEKLKYARDAQRLNIKKEYAKKMSISTHIVPISIYTEKEEKEDVFYHIACSDYISGMKTEDSNIEFIIIAEKGAESKYQYVQIYRNIGEKIGIYGFIFDKRDAHNIGTALTKSVFVIKGIVLLDR